MRCHGGLAVPNGVVPGDDEVAPVRKVQGTRSRFPSVCWGPLCKSQGPICNLGLVSGPFVNHYVPPLPY